MRILFLIAICYLIVSCQKEITFFEQQRATSITDTSRIAVVKKVCHSCSTTDTTYLTYKNNTIAGKKGFIITHHFSSAPSDRMQSDFSYTTDGHLAEIKEKYIASGRVDSGYWKFTWQSILLRNVKLQDGNGTIEMNRNFSYDNSRDTLFVRAEVVTPSSLIKDSVAYLFLTDTSWNKPITTLCSGVQSRPGTSGTFDNYGFYRQKNYGMLTNNVAYVKSFEEWFRDPSGTGPLYMKDSSVTGFVRLTQATDYWAALEDKIIGKELRILDFGNFDTLSGIRETYFSLHHSFFSFNSFISYRQPLLQAFITGHKEEDGIVILRQTNQEVFKQTYTIDNSNRIKTIKAYDPQTNQLLYETIIEYF